MDVVEGKNRRYFTPEARIAAMEARRRKAETAASPRVPAIFAVRLSDGRFGWEIRRFGSIVLDRSETAYDTLLLARSAGEHALSRMTAQV